MSDVVRIPGKYDAKAVSMANRLECLDDSRTIQSGKEDADINVIVKRMGIGVMPIGQMKIPLVGDFSHIGDFRDVLEQAEAAGVAFRQLPAELRNRFGNDPAVFMDHVDDPAFQQELINLGAVLDKPVEPAIVTPKPEDSPKV